MEPQRGAAGEKLAAVHREVLRPQTLGGVEGLPAVEQVPGGTQLGHIQGGRPRQFRDGQGLPLVARDMEPDGMLGRKGPDRIIERCHGIPSWVK